MNKLAMWLNEHAVCLGDSLKANVLYLWCIVISFVVVTVLAASGVNGKLLEYVLMALLLGGAVLPPIVALFKKPWTPWYWFPIAIGNALGCMIAVLIGIIFGFASI